MNPKIIDLLDFEYPSILHNNESEQILMKAVNSRKTKLVLKKNKKCFKSKHCEGTSE